MKKVGTVLRYLVGIFLLASTVAQAQSGKISVTISPTSATLTSGSQKQFVASVANTANTAVTWSASLGAITATGLYTAPSVTAATTATVRARSVANPKKWATANVTIDPASPPPTASLGASPTGILTGQSSTLTWSTQNATSVSITGLGTVGPSGSQAVFPSSSTTYTLTASGPGGSAGASASVTVTAPSVMLSWSASTSTVAGYDVYSSTTAGGPYNLVATWVTLTSYTDASVTAGQTYYYVVAAVSSTGQESAYSNEVKAVIP